MSQRVLDPLDRMSEILFGIIMVLTFTGSIRVADAGREDLRTVLVGALGCNLAWGVVDGVMFLMAAFMLRARTQVALNNIRRAGDPATARQVIVDALPETIAGVLTDRDVELLRERLDQLPVSTEAVRLRRADWLGAAGVFLLVFLSTFPVILPLIVVSPPQVALRLSNVVAVLMLFILGWSLNRYVGKPGWWSGFGMVLIGLVLVGLTMALGG